jgi:hypothetical protein
VPEYDAFGREIGEDTLQSWRQGSEALPPQPAPAEPRRREPAAAAVSAGDPLGAPATPPAAPRRPPPQAGPQRIAFPTGFRPRKRRRGARILVLLIVLWVGFNLISSLADKVEEAAREITIPTPSLRPTQPAEPPTGLDAGSLLRPAAFERALAQIRRRGGGKLENLRVAPERIDATLITRRGTLVNVQVSATDGYRRFSESGPGFSASDTIPFGRLDARIPQKLTRAAAERLGSPPGRINYLVPSLSDGKIVWGAYFKTGAIFIADARGKIIRRIS